LRDSHYVVGGSLSVACVGALEPIPNIDNRFTATTDTVINDTTRATKVILVDRDPLNQAFIDSLGSDIIRAIAWVEWAGSNDHNHCDNPYNPRYNNYWDDVIANGDTCRETKLPCENIASTATGTMQMLRGTWDTLFTGQMPQEPEGYTRCNWDSLAWNWKINIHNGKYVFFVNNPAHMQLYQQAWDSVCTLCNEADSLPLYTNREDLSSYGYKEGASKMRKVTSVNWLDTMKNPKGGKYVRDVRGSKYVKGWQ